jgi:hypothetical protein
MIVEDDRERNEADAGGGGWSVDWWRHAHTGWSWRHIIIIIIIETRDFEIPQDTRV